MVACPSCHRTNAPEFTFCMYCGARIDAVRGPKDPDVSVAGEASGVGADRVEFAETVNAANVVGSLDPVRVAGAAGAVYVEGGGVVVGSEGRGVQIDSQGVQVSGGEQGAKAEGTGADVFKGTVPGKPALGGVVHGAGSSPTPISPVSPISRPISSVPLPPGSVVDGKYSTKSVIGEGGMGVVYLADDIHTQMPVAIKAIRQEYTHREEFRQRILAEGRALAAIDHNNVVRLNAVVVEEDALYLVMQYIEGEPLDAMIARYAAENVPMPLELVLRIFMQVLDGVGAVHDAGVVHRDLKPANILIRTRDSVAKVTDFGIAKDEEDAREGRGQTKGIIGSLLYMAPEQIKGQRDLDKRVDIYGLGMLLYEMLTGKVPFDGESDFEIMKLHLQGAVPLVSHVRADVPAQIDAVIQRACAKNREDRYSSTAQMAADLRAIPIPTLLSAGYRVDTGRGAGQVAVGVDAYTPGYPGTVLSPMQGSMQGYMPGQVQGNATVLGPMQGQVPVFVRTDVGLAATIPDSVNLQQGGSKSSRGWIFAAVGLVVLGGVATGVLLGGSAAGWFDRQSAKGGLESPLVPSLAMEDSAAGVGSGDALESDVEARNPLDTLVGAWKSDSGRVYDAVMSGTVLDFRLRSAQGLEASGYTDGETRFVLHALETSNDEFGVTDKVRPALPADLKYDFQDSRGSCQVVRTEVNGKPLRARFDGTRLTVEGIKIAPVRSMFMLRAGKVYNCRDLDLVKTSMVQTPLERTN